MVVRRPVKPVDSHMDGLPFSGSVSVGLFKLSALAHVWVLVAGMATAFATIQNEPRFPHSSVMSSDDVAEAIRLGQSGDLAPYVASHSIGGGPAPRLAVYTPFIRVARAARAQLLVDGKARWPPEAGVWIASPEVLVVIGNPCTGPDAGCDLAGQNIDPRNSPPNRVYIGRRIRMQPGESPQLARPIRLVPLPELGWLGAIPVEDPVVAATFSPDAFQAGSSVVAEWGRWDGVTVYAGGYLEAADLARWR